MEPVEKEHRVCDVSQLVVLGHGKGEVDEGPCDNSRATIVEKLEVKVFSNAGIKFNAHKEIINDGSREFPVVRVRGKEMGFGIRKEGQKVAIDIRGNEERAPIVMDHREFEPASVKRDTNEEGVGDNPGKESIDLYRVLEECYRCV